MRNNRLHIGLVYVKNYLSKRGNQFSREQTITKMFQL